ncbi:MAG: 23S rRNA (adenine(2503)-C(2))-methyltransferase RlmN [Elusimicrobiota bacterium]
MDVEKLRAALKERKQPAYRFEQVLKAVYEEGVSSYDEITTLPAVLRETLSVKAPILSVSEDNLVVSRDGLAHKALLSLKDGLVIETVLLKPKPGRTWSVCVSSQVGCAMGCTFCATGLMGFRRDLSAEEIADQVLYWRQYAAANKIGGRITNVVYMGMGEPMLALDSVEESLRILMDPKRFALSARHISVSTVGIILGMERFIKRFPQVNLALSLHSADDTLRTKLVPVNKKYPLKALTVFLRKALESSRRKIFIEYVLLEGENDSRRYANALAQFVHKVGRPDLLHVNLIVWNPTETQHQKPSVGTARLFREWLQDRGVRVTIRKNLGADIQGACGQLFAGKNR